MALRKPKGQGQLFDPAKVTSHQFPPVEHVEEGAKSYNKQEGRTYRPVNNQLQVDPRRGRAQYQVYRKGMRADSDTPRMDRAYQSAEEHINRQYDFMTKPVEHGGMGIRHEIISQDPYATPADMASDVRDNRRIRTYATSTTAAGDTNRAYQPPTLQAWSNDTNDKFRAVHDVFGHAASGRGFSRHGEEAAYLNHRQMFPKEAHPALASETRGQNSYLNFGGDEFPNPGIRKVTMPDWATRNGKLPESRPRKARSTGVQGIIF